MRTEMTTTKNDGYKQLIYNLVPTHSMRRLIFCTALFAVCSAVELTFNSYDPEYGVYIGKFSSQQSNDIAGMLYAINDSAIQIINFSWSGRIPDTFFWLDPTERPTRNGVRVPTFEYGLSPIGKYPSDTPRVVLILPNDRKISEFKSLSLFSLRDDSNYGSVQINENLTAPKAQMLQDELIGDRFKIFGLGNKAPDGYFFVGQGPSVSKDSGVKAMIRGRDTPELILPMNERYTGGKDVYVQLPDDYDIQRIEFLSIYSVKYDISYASLQLRNVSRYSIPPYIPPQKSYERGKRGYQAMHKVARPPQYVWYVNGYLANLYLKRGITYTFIVGVAKHFLSRIQQPLYLTNDSYGGYSKLTKAEQALVKTYAPENPSVYSGRLCRWTANKHISRQLSSWLVKKVIVQQFFEFTPTLATPNTLYFESYNNYQMGSAIFVVDEFPGDLKHIVEEPFQYDARQHQTNLELTRENGGSSRQIFNSAGIFTSLAAIFVLFALL
uniref:DM13 domain-containing protein n=1 Tax=Ditylenchus dipsaci TaxID=166011 RepID=A0A915CS51_9BILA